MPRTDENGRQLKALLDYLLDGEIDAKDIIDALGISSSTYYRRIKEADYPSAEELRLVADRFALSYPDLQIQFGLMSRQEVWQYIEATGPGPLVVAATPETTQRVETARPRRLSDLTPRLDAPPL
ncbi:DNA-binding protein [Mycobacterium sp. NAZ190054]|uniref:DNA-binding protein n=1 Tax=Mycobacterium sp. NAZ190054 TaxID=1747766 RepID=UPI00079964A5|nr:DNA-binding protein [Mycobacterium sp. NAZ190054]KWX66143.1 DNA-binding protein [Mycobacterium sp. NAZ190054]